MPVDMFDQLLTSAGGRVGQSSAGGNRCLTGSVDHGCLTGPRSFLPGSHQQRTSLLVIPASLFCIELTVKSGGAAIG
jgi:hypothetical protein